MSDFEQGLANIMGSFMEVNLDCVEKQNQEIEQLQQENQQLKEKEELHLNRIDELTDRVVDLKSVIDEARQLAIKQIDISNKEIDKIKYTNGYNPSYKTLLVGQELDIIKIQEKLLQILDKVKENK